MPERYSLNQQIAESNGVMDTILISELFSPKNDVKNINRSIR
jgi:hypothetical protein